MHRLGHLRLDGNHIHPLLYAIPCHQSLNELSLGQVIPVRIALDVLLHEALDGQLHRHRKPFVPAAGMNGIEPRPAAHGQYTGLGLAPAPRQQNDAAILALHRKHGLGVGEVHAHVLPVVTEVNAATHNQMVWRWPWGFQAGAMTLGMSERLSSRAGASANSP